jgi:hypothetical protein
MSCLTTSATRRSRSVPAAVLIASAAASSHEVLLVPMISVTLYTLMTLSFEHMRPAPEPTKPPCPVVGVTASMEVRAGRLGRSTGCAGTAPRAAPNQAPASCRSPASSSHAGHAAGRLVSCGIAASTRAAAVSLHWPSASTPRWVRVTPIIGQFRLPVIQKASRRICAVRCARPSPAAMVSRPRRRVSTWCSPVRGRRSHVKRHRGRTRFRCGY